MQKVYTMLAIQDIFTFSGRKFYQLFEEVANQLVEMSRLFVLAANDDNHQLIDKYLAKFSELDQQCDAAIHKLSIELGKNFITPFDREDIHALATAMNGIADYMYSSAKQFKSHDIIHPDAVAVNFAKQQEQIVGVLVKTINSLKNKRNLDKLVDPCEEMRRLLLASDNALDAGLSGLLYNELAVKDVLKRMDLYENLQYLNEKYHDSVNVIESMMIKYS